jgi:hypothetical protein
MQTLLSHHPAGRVRRRPAPTPLPQPARGTLSPQELKRIVADLLG